MTDRLQQLLGLLDLETIEENFFRGLSTKNVGPRIFGGEVMAQALVAGARTLPADHGLLANSLHGYFLRPGNIHVPILFRVERIRDGKSFCTRRVVAQQKGEAIFSMDLSFHKAESGFDHHLPMPDDIASIEQAEARKAEFQQAYSQMQPRFQSKRPFQIIDAPPKPGELASKRVWFKPQGIVPDDPILHQALLAFLSDMGLMGTSRIPHRQHKRSQLIGASLDHAMWFHRPFKLDDWLMYDTDAPISAHARGFNRGMIYSRHGVLIASTQQESLMRIKRAP